MLSSPSLKLHWVLLLLSLLLFACQPQRQTALPIAEIEIHNFDEFRTTITQVSHFEFIYNEDSVLTLSQLVDSGEYEYLINATFFDYKIEDDVVHTVHVGHLYFDGTLYPSKDMTPEDHAQLTHIAQYDPTAPSLVFIAEDDFVSAGGNSIIEFQTGPLVIEDNEIRMDLIEGAVNGTGRYFRTMLATTDQKDIFLITVRERATLPEFAEFLLSIDLFEGKRLDVLNLDGGWSTLIYSETQPDLNYWSSDITIYENAHLPFYLGVR